MSFRTAIILGIMDKKATAKKQIDKIEALLLENDATNRNTFLTKINKSLQTIAITDAKEIDYNSKIITEFKSDSGLHKISDSITSTFQYAVSNIDSRASDIKKSAEAKERYFSMINSVIEASKSTSSIVKDLKFTMNRLTPGVLAFLYASTISMQDELVFGTESVATTAIYYSLMYSIEDVKNIAAFDALQIDIESYAKMKTLQAALLDELANGEIAFETWKKPDAAYAVAAKQIKIRIRRATSDSPRSLQTIVIKDSKTNIKQIKSAIKKLSTMGDTNKLAVLKSQERLANNYFN